MAEEQKIYKRKFEFEIIKVQEAKLRFKYYVQIGEDRYEISTRESYEDILKEIRKKTSVLETLKTERAKEELKKEILLDLLTILTKLEF